MAARPLNMPSCSRPITWPTTVCVAVTVVFGLIIALIGFDMPETASVDQGRARAIHERLHPPDPLTSVGDYPPPPPPVGGYMR